MRDFKEPYYTGPECVCCKDQEAVREQERERLIKKFDEADSACSPWAIAVIQGKSDHDGQDHECVCNSCLEEQSDRLDEQIALIKGENE